MSTKLLLTTRLGILTSTKRDGDPISVPIWFDWNEKTLQFFAGTDSKKVKRLAHNPRISLLVANNVGEPEGWIAFDGDVTLHKDGAAELANRLAHRYWDMNNQKNVDMLKIWMSSPDAFVRYAMTPTKIRQGK